MKDFKPREYQQKIFEIAKRNNSLVVLPTGMGKTAIAAMLTENRLNNYLGSKTILLAPTKPLAEQHQKSFEEFFPNHKVSLFTGSVSPKKREELFRKSDIIISTPQGMENDVISRRIDLREVSLITFDEAHRASGNYAYCYIAKKYYETSDHVKILALTASPGTDNETIAEICKNLYIEEIDYRNSKSEDVQEHVKPLQTKYIELELPEILIKIRDYLQKTYDTKLLQGKELGHLKGDLSRYTKTTLLKAMTELHGQMSKGDKSFEILKTISLLSEAMKVGYAIELIETQGLTATEAYMEKLKEEALKTKVKAVKNLVKDINFRTAGILIESAKRKNIEHPKLEKLKELTLQEIQNFEQTKIIIFSQYRDTGSQIINLLKQQNINAKLFVGQAKKKGTGMTQKKQKEMIEAFKAGQFNVLVATSVGEEGLDIPEVDLVIFYEPVPSAIRTVQRRGRTGRQKEGKVYTLIAKNTRDEAYRWSAHHKEKRMYKTLETMKKKITPQKREPQEKLKAFEEAKPEILVDYREKGSATIKALLNQGVNIKLEKLDVADYIISQDTAIEFKTIPDFVDSILDKRLLTQAKDLKQFKKPLIILQGEEDLYSQRKIHPNAIRGTIAALTVNFGIPIIQTKNPKDTAEYIQVLVTREQTQKINQTSLHKSKPLSTKEGMEYVASSIPGFGPVLSAPLLKKFKTLKKII